MVMAGSARPLPDGAGVGSGRGELRGDVDRDEAGQDPGQHVGAHPGACDVETGPARRDVVRPDRVEPAPEGAALQGEPQHDEHGDQEGEHAERHVGDVVTDDRERAPSR